MAKPSWLVRREQEVPHAYKRCVNCKHAGEPCGTTNNLGTGIGRVRMYRCRKHPGIQFYFRTYACVDYEYGPTGIE